MIINHNISALNTLNKLNKNNNSTNKAMEKLSSGLRVNKAADDTAGLAISEKIRAQIRGLQQAERNVQDGISLIQTAEGGLSEIQNPSLQRLRELSIQASNDTLTDQDRQEIQKEVEQIKKSIDSIANNTEFNGINLLNRKKEEVTYDHGAVLNQTPVNSNGHFLFGTENGHLAESVDDNQTLVYRSSNTSYPKVQIDGTVHDLQSNLVTPTTESNGVHTTVYSVNDVNVTQQVSIAGSQNEKYEIRYNIENTSGASKNIGFLFNVDTMLGSDDTAPFIVNNTFYNGPEQEFTGASVPEKFQVYNTSDPRFKAEGILKSTGDFTIIEEPDKFGIGTWSQVDDWNWTPDGAIGDSGYSLWWNSRFVSAGGSFEVNTFYGQGIPEDKSFTNIPKVTIQTGANEGQDFNIMLSDARTKSLGIDGINLSTRQGAESALSKIDKALGTVSGERGKFGAYQNRLEHTLENISNYEVNLTSAESRIRDADMAKEMMNFTKNNILSQSAQTLLSQSNQKPQQVLQLLQG